MGVKLKCRYRRADKHTLADYFPSLTPPASSRRNPERRLRPSPSSLTSGDLNPARVGPVVQSFTVRSQLYSFVPPAEIR